MERPEVDAVGESEDVKRRLSRREFARRAALASAVATIAPAAAVAGSAATRDSNGSAVLQEPTSSTGASAAASQSSAPNMPKLSAESQAEAEARYQAILAVYGARFSEEQKGDLHRLCAVVQPSLDHIRGYKVENGDGTALYLKPGFEREKQAKVATSGTKAVPGSGPKKS